MIKDEPTGELLVDGGEVVFQGRAVDYDTKEIQEGPEALTVNFAIDDPQREDTFTRENLIGLVLTADGKFLGWNLKFATQFVRPEE